MTVINIVPLAAQLYIRWRGVETPEYGIHGNGCRPRELDPFRRMYLCAGYGVNRKIDHEKTAKKGDKQQLIFDNFSLII
jgi:hypothetical protein